MRQQLKQLLPPPLRDGVRRYLSARSWKARGYAAPSPGFIKEQVLLRNGFPGATWIETGTYRGDTTAVLAGQAARVYSIEPADALFHAAARRFARAPHVEILHGLSETVLPRLLPEVQGDVCFWLDAHFSSGPTHRGPVDTPVMEELRTITRELPRWGRVAVLIDDMRHFDPRLPDCGHYPPVADLVTWAEAHDLKWHIEHDIFVARRA